MQLIHHRQRRGRAGQIIAHAREKFPVFDPPAPHIKHPRAILWHILLHTDPNHLPPRSPSLRLVGPHLDNLPANFFFPGKKSHLCPLHQLRQNPPAQFALHRLLIDHPSRNQPRMIHVRCKNPPRNRAAPARQAHQQIPVLIARQAQFLPLRHKLFHIFHNPIFKKWRSRQAAKLLQNFRHSSTVSA
jgi:hypothetical protein